MRRHPIADPSGGQILTVTASFGVAELERGEVLEQLVDRADRAMYAAKSAGRNRVLSTVQLVPALHSLTPQSVPQTSSMAPVVAMTPKPALEALSADRSAL